MASAVVMDAFVDEVAQHVRKQKDRTHAVPETFKLAGAEVGESVTFCKLWPGVRAGLEVLKAFVPGWARWLIDAVEAIGDKACPK